ncbi:MAG: pyridoxal phosphate-dependent aminotransferase [Muribaculaceae bacterium]|nr:pyridoxal phosphate-dependent aminotransferase [Muribaculaceae bacterium]
MEQSFDFDTIISRRNTNSYKWDSHHESDMQPMWVADMDFRTAPPVIEALSRRVQHGIFGYTYVPEAFYNATEDWFSTKHGWNINPDSIIYTSGVVPAISAIIKAFTSPGDAVATLTPVFNCFFSSIRNNDCSVASVPLKIINNRYEIDFDLLAKVFVRPDVKIFILCNPHNPGGRVWTRQELKLIAELAHENGVKVISDEIHCELTYPDFSYTPYGTLPAALIKDAVVCISPSKAFNIAGLQIAVIVANDKSMRQRIDKAININEVCDVNPFGVDALIAAYTQGAPWLEALNKYLYGNYLYVKEYFEKYLAPLNMMSAESTYLAWIDCTALGLTSEEIDAILQREAHVRVSPGSIFGPEGEGFIRLNFACPRQILEEVLPKLKNLTNRYKAK